MKATKLFISLIFLISCYSFFQEKSFYKKLSDAAISIIDPTIRYDPSYERIPYPNGDVDKKKGVCTDVIIRAYRVLGIDLQKEVHEDMKAHFDKYPSRKAWGLNTTDRNIDHRRVPNLQVFFQRNGESLPITKNAKDYLPGDIVTWNLGRGITHIGIVIERKSGKGTPLIVHNIGRGQIAEDILFSYQITGHYRYKK